MLPEVTAFIILKLEKVYVVATVKGTCNSWGFLFANVLHITAFLMYYEKVFKENRGY